MNFFETRLRASRVLLVLGAMALATACTDSTQQDPAQSAAETAVAVHPAVQPTPAASPAAAQGGAPRQNQGVVRAVEIAGAYTYARVDVDGDEFWLATTITALEPGAEVAWKDYAMMTNFRSKALDREFEQILFVDRLLPVGGQTASLRRGVVAESLNAAGYSFIRVDEDGHSVWLAAPEIALEVGQTVEWQGGGQMRNFTSRSLDRVFDEIIFVDRVQIS